MIPAMLKPKFDAGICVLCDKKVTEHRDELSKTEYQSSGMCQACQDLAFGDDGHQQGTVSIDWHECLMAIIFGLIENEALSIDDILESAELTEEDKEEIKREYQRMR